MLELEESDLMRMPEPFDGYLKRLAPVSGSCLVVALSNRYLLPCEMLQKEHSVICFFCNLDGAHQIGSASFKRADEASRLAVRSGLAT